MSGIKKSSNKLIIMSDFGAIITFQKKNGSFSDDDKELIIKELKNIINHGNFPSNIKNGDYVILKKWYNQTYCSMITEYYDDEDSEEIRGFAEIEDIEEANQIITELKKVIGINFDMEVRFEDW